MSKQKGSLHQQTYTTVKKCLEAVNKEGKDEFINELKSKQGILAKIRLWIFLNPNKFFIFSNVFWLSLIIISALTSNNNNNIIIRFILFLLLSLFYLLITIVIEKMISRSSMDWYVLWSPVLVKYLSETQPNTIKAKHRLKRSILYYQRKGEVTKNVINLFWGAIIVSCISSDLNFQYALLKMSLLEMLILNLFGTLCIIFLPFIYWNYCIKYEFPIAWMENVLYQIEIEDM